MKRAFVFIDGSNFYHKLKEFNNALGAKHRLLSFRYDNFVKWLVTPNELAGAT